MTGYDRSEVIRDWWAHHIGNRDAPASRALAARLGRADRIGALAEPAVQALGRQLSLCDPVQLAALAQVLAWVRTSANRHLPQLLGSGETPPMSTLRFQHLIRVTGDELPQALRRALPMVDRTCNVGALGRDLLLWSHPDHGEAVRARWCFHYFGASAPASLQSEAET